MPQLSTTFIFTTYLWTWLILCLITQKIKTTLVNKAPMKPPQHKTKKLSPQMPWT